MISKKLKSQKQQRKSIGCLINCIEQLILLTAVQKSIHGKELVPYFFGDKLVEMDRSSYSRMKQARSSFDFIINKKKYSVLIYRNRMAANPSYHPRTKQRIIGNINWI